MTLAFSLSAAKRLENPAAAFADAREWTRYLGIVAREPRAGERFAREHGLPQDFFTAHRGRAESLAMIGEGYGTERHVFVGTGDDDRRLAESMDWEYRPIAEAADRAGWELTPDDDAGLLAGLIDRFRNR